jgi:hypothetical protein
MVQCACLTNKSNMPRFAITFLLLVTCFSLPTPAHAQRQANKKTSHKVIKPPVIDHGAVAAIPQAQPAPPQTPEHGPSSPPEVTFKGGQLTITARNSTLGDVLNAVKLKTGAQVEMPAASNERVVGQFGPGAPRDVMVQLLNGSHFDYVLMGSPSDPGALNKVVLMARANGPEPAPTPQAQPAETGSQAGLQVIPQVQTDQPEDNGGEMPPEMQQPEEEQPEQPDQAEQPEQPDQPPPGQNGPVVKTPEQLLRELQQQQQQQQGGQTPPQERQ